LDSKNEVLSLGQLVSKLRKEKGFSQRKFAQLSGLSNTTISRIENGETTHPDIETLKSLAAHLDYSESALIELVHAGAGHHQAKKHAKLKFLQQPVKEIKRYSSVCIAVAEPDIEKEAELKEPEIAQPYFKPTETKNNSIIEPESKVAIKGMKLITLRMEKNITQKELADALGLDKTMISQYEGEIIKPEHSIVERLADFFGVSVEYLTGEPKIKTPLPNEPKKSAQEEILLKPLTRDRLRPEYAAIAEEIQAAGIDIEDVRAFIDMIRKYRDK